ncbi:putative group 1 glycosyl transferase [Ectopseudomonas oleovorans]|uniref:Putative group 1 glycosyl transferase n=2 Tax=Ectopseudomonas oleovorans TaxID=301 RepID=W6REL1_ECTO5|nr:putative group 1 glycosyl transferase [Pseudomonas oleovorans CECT 5344]CDR90919.1 putative group 1 glycosyl transferase [Pseudomonas oleovorans]
MTAVLGALLAASKGAQIYLDIRDIFVETLAGVFDSLLFRPVVWAFGLLERWSIQRATVVNLVSPGFLPYFQSRYPDRRFSFFSNGVDSEFSDPVACNESVRAEGVPLRVLYAGNIGDGQGLHLVVPALAERLKGRVTFQVIGDGRLAGALCEAIDLRQLDNVEFLAPMSRQKIKVFYEQADVLFLHLNDLGAFKRVLPSKLFEYAATDKPIWAGVAGYAAEFIAAELTNAAVFAPCDIEAALESFEQLEFGVIDRTAFAQRYARERIMDEMAQDILRLPESA